jgi:3-dehydroquinate dehydratase-2
MKIKVINGPNLNLLGTREIELYGKNSLQDLHHWLKSEFPLVDFFFSQSNHEGEIIDEIQQCIQNEYSIIINPGGFSHTSVAIYDALLNITFPKIEVHITNIHQRESFRHNSITAQACDGVIAGLGCKGYHLAVSAIQLLLAERSNCTI